MAEFWSSSKLSPTRRRNFKVSITNNEKLKGAWFWAKTVTKPSFDVAVSEYQVINNLLKYPGLVTWNDVTVTMVDTGKKTKELLTLFRQSGYDYPDGTSSGSQTIGIRKQLGNLETQVFTIEQYGNDLTKPIEKWQLANCFIKSISFGDLDYSSDELVEIQLVLSYDWAELS